MSQNLWENVEFLEEELDTEQGKQKVYRLIRFNENEWINFNFLSIMNEFLLKMQLKTISINDIFALQSIIENLVKSNRKLFTQIGNKLKDINDPHLQKILKSLEIAFSTIGRNLYVSSRWYMLITEMFYKYYVQCLRDIEELTNLRVHKGVPFQMLGLIYGQTDRPIRMICQLGMTLKEDRISKLQNTPANDLLNMLRANEIIFFNDSYHEFLNDQNKGILKVTKSLPDFKNLLEYLKNQMRTFPEDSLLFITQKYIFIRPYLIEIAPFDDIFSSLLRVEFLNLFTAFIETLLKRVLISDNDLMRLINKFNKKALTFNCFDLHPQEAIITIPSYNNFRSLYHDDRDPNYYNEFCAYILSLTITEPISNNKIDISDPIKLKILQASMILRESRNRFHHDLNTTSILQQVSIDKNIPTILPYISDVPKFNLILKYLSYYCCLILTYAFENF